MAVSGVCNDPSMAPRLTRTDYPAYELYTDVLRKGIFDEPGKQLRLVVGRDRKVKEVHKF